MKSYVCSICGYTYNEAEGDVSQGIAPGTKFEDLPDSFVCPICGAPKEDFQEA
ncbi:MAG: rubredoxin [Clostridia bacterium]